MAPSSEVFPFCVFDNITELRSELYRVVSAGSNHGVCTSALACAALQSGWRAAPSAVAVTPRPHPGRGSPYP